MFSIHFLSLTIEFKVRSSVLRIKWPRDIYGICINAKMCLIESTPSCMESFTCRTIYDTVTRHPSFLCDSYLFVFWLSAFGFDFCISFLPEVMEGFWSFCKAHAVGLWQKRWNCCNRCIGSIVCWENDMMMVLIDWILLLAVTLSDLLSNLFLTCNSFRFLFLRKYQNHNYSSKKKIILTPMTIILAIWSS